MKGSSMNKAIILFIMLMVGAVHAQNTNAPSGSERSLESEAVRRALANPPVIQTSKPNQIVAGRLIYEGIAVEAIKTHTLLQLINPAAPPEYGSPADNIVVEPRTVMSDLTTGRIGLKFFSIRF
jgi:hypothetical protein